MMIFFEGNRRTAGAYRGSSPFGKERLSTALVAAMGIATAACSSDVVLENAADAGILPGADAEAPSATDASVPPPSPDAAAATSHLRVSSTLVDFAKVACGAVGTAPSVTISNDGGAALTWSATLRRGAPFSIVGAAAGTLAAGASTTLTLAFDAPSGVRSRSAFTDAVLLDDGIDTTQDEQITVRAQLSGADLAFTRATIDFGSVDVNGTPATRAVALENRGDQPATVSFDSQAQGPFSLVYGAGTGSTIALAPNAATSGIVARFAPDADGPASASFAVVASGTVCTTPTDTLELTGEGISSDLRVNEPELDFGLVACGATGNAKTLVLSNSGTAAVSYTLTLVKGAASPFTLSRTSGSLNPNANQSVTVTPKAIPAPTSSAIDTASNAFGDALRIVELGGTVHTVDLLQTAKGAVFSVLPASVSVPATQVGSSRDYTVNLLNTGSARAHVQYTLTPLDGPFRTSRALGPTPVDANDSLVDTITFEPLTAGTFGASLTWSLVPVPGEVLCAPMPASIAISGTATP